MSNEWEDRIIKGGFIVVGTVAGIGCVTAFIAVIMGAPVALRAASAILAVAAGIGAACVIAVNIPRLPRKGRDHHRSDT